MRKIQRIALCNLRNHESLFDLDFDNVYSLHEIREFFRILSKSQECTPPVISHQDLVFCQKSWDEVLLLLVFKGPTPSASDRVAMIQFCKRFLRVCQDFLGALSIENILANITLLAEIVDSMLIGGFVHLTSTEKIRGFLSQTYTLPTSSPRPFLPIYDVFSTAKLAKLTGSGHQPQGRSKVVPVLQPQTQEDKEHIYLDWIETLDYVTGSSGELTCVTRGVVSAKNVSSGQKLVHLQLNKSYSKLIGQHSFTRCVDSSEFNTAGRLQASLALGQTQLMSYQLPSTSPPFLLEARHGSGAGELVVTVHCKVPPAVMCLNSSITFSLHGRSRGLLKLSNMMHQTLELNDDHQTIVWNIPEIAGQTKASAHFKVLK
ncbi:AP-4 complex subunit mu-1-like isoform X2 [Watersipora subatra]|uniref:AP-4 complex subunit mu-1-like isoform X2 n=1 Tax=Watersipora subatra TaxID=2589382 RepID=UPI00355B8B83